MKKMLFIAAITLTVGTDASAEPYNFMERNRFGNQDIYNPPPSPKPPMFRDEPAPAPRPEYARPSRPNYEPLGKGGTDAPGGTGQLFKKPEWQNGW